MKKVIQFFVLICFSMNGVFAQNQELKNTKNNSITIAPLSIFNILDPAIQIGYQRELPNDLIFQIEGGIILRHSIFGFMGLNLYNGSVNYSYSGYKLQTELKKVLYEKGNKVNRKSYIAGEFFYSKNRGNVNNTYKNSTGESYADFFIQEKHKYRLGAKLGMQLVFGRNFLIDYSVGMGLAYNHVEHFDRENINDKSYSPLYGFILRQGDFIRLNLPTNFKIGYKF